MKTNEFSGSIPDSSELSESIEIFDIYDNRMRGTILQFLGEFERPDTLV